MAFKICQKFKIFPNITYICKLSKICQKFKIFPKWRKFAKSGHTEWNPNRHSLNVRSTHCLNPSTHPHTASVRAASQDTTLSKVIYLHLLWWTSVNVSLSLFLYLFPSLFLSFFLSLSLSLSLSVLYNLESKYSVSQLDFEYFCSTSIIQFT